jgi:hypothetical protein
MKNYKINYFKIWNVIIYIYIHKLIFKNFNLMKKKYLNYQKN